MGSRDLLRAFIAISLSDALRAELAAAVGDVRDRGQVEGVRWVRPANYHLTLRFLSQVSVGQVEEILASLRGSLCALDPFVLKSQAVAWFPSARRARVVAVEVSQGAELQRLAEAVESSVVAVGFAPESRRFRGHITVGRVRAAIHNAPPFEPSLGSSTTAVDHVVLVRSELHPTGAVYTTLGEIPLGAAP
jgi:2'-5' RNA ligase